MSQAVKRTDADGNPPRAVPSVEEVARQYLTEGHQLTERARKKLNRARFKAVVKVERIDEKLAKVMKAQSNPNNPNFEGLMRQEATLKFEREDAIGVFTDVDAHKIMDDRNRLLKSSRREQKPKLARPTNGVEPRRRAFTPRQERPRDQTIGMSR